MIFYVVTWAPALACLFIVRHYTSDPEAFDAGAVAATLLGLLLFGGLYISIGCCASAGTRSQAVAVMVTLAIGASLFSLAVLADKTPVQASWQSQVLACFGFFDMMHDYARGVVDTRSVVLFATLTLFFLFLTLRIVESRRWK